ncbi:Origin recognition complex subunit 3 [Haplosporangium sp. Z 767]|nr:Origin recognition complex subunit 3 [Haplosporangium sp. Z 11]KAF9193372.1 Origin recognition complex subunit 3 [Haplosporangium sp. Z 767]
MDEYDSLTDAVFLVQPKTDGKAKRKVNGKGKGADQGEALPTDHFRLDGFQRLKDVDEPWEAAELRHALFNKEWDLISSRIEDVMMNMNTIALSAIYHFVESAYTPKATRAIIPVQELPAGLIFAGINVPDHDLVFQQIAKTLSSPTPPTSIAPTSTVETTRSDIQMDLNTNTEEQIQVKNHVVILQSKDCTNLKAALKSMIEQFLGLGIAGAVNPLEGGMRLQNYDMIVLERWYQSIADHQQVEAEKADMTSETQQQHSKRPKLVVIIQDFESFDPETLQDLIIICSNYQDRIPFVLLMGLATSMDALHQGLQKSVLSLLQTRKFQMQQSSECLTAIVEDLFIHANAGLMVGPLPLKQLIDQFIQYNFSVGGFISNLKYVVMHHFYANPLSILCDRSLASDSKALDLLGKGHIDHIRMLQSFQRYVEYKMEGDQDRNLIPDPQVAEMLLKDDEFLTFEIPDLVQDLVEYHQNFALIFDFLWFLQSRFSISVLKKSKRVLYFMALDGTLTESSHITFLLSLVRKMNSNDMMLFVEDWLQFFKDSPRCRPKKSSDQENAMDKELVAIQSVRDRMAALLDVVSEDSVTSSSEIEDNEEGETETETQDQSMETNGGAVQTSKSGGPGARSTFIKKRRLVSLNADETESRQTRIAKKTRETARLPKGAQGAYTVLVTEIDQTLARLFRTYLKCHTTMPLNEIFYYSQVTIQQKAFLPQPRASVQTALGQPEIYLNCDCCHMPSASDTSTRVSLADVVLPTQHDTCILYKLYVECGRMINMYDWFTAFGMILERGLDANQGGHGDDGQYDDDNGKDGSSKRKRAKKKHTKAAAAAIDMDKKQRLDQKEVQARFISGVAELQFMGFIKPTNRKTDHVMRLTWGNI